MTAVLGIPPSSGGIADDVRQNGYARNEAQVVDAVTAAGIAEAAEALAAAAVQDLSAVVPCGTEDEACAREFIAEFTRKAYRRPASESEVERLVSVYVAGADEGFAGGIELVIAAVLQSPQFLYHFEIGATPGPAEARARLTSHEVAESLAYLFTGAPPDPELAAAADAGSLYDAAARAAEARRLLTTAAARPQLELMVTEWLSIDSLRNKGKDAVVYPDFLDFRASMVAESRAFVSDVLWNGDGTLTTLLTADFTVADDTMAGFYGVDAAGGGRLSLTGIERRGILNHASWLAATAHGDDSGPVTRGLALLRRVLCANVPGHAQLGVAAPFPPNDRLTSARQRIAAHATVAACATCHDIIDNAGFLFENYDGMGRLRSEDNGVPVDTSGGLSPNVSQWGVESTSGVFSNSQELIAVLGASPDVRQCFARNVVRFAGAARVKDIEERLLRTFGTWTDEQRDQVLEPFVELVRDDSFVYRSFNPPLETLDN
jgi:hypothetical protein